MARRSRQDPRGPDVGAGDRSPPAGRRGGVIVVTGPDGAGKSTLCDELSTRLPESAPVVRLHHRPGVLPVRGGRDAASSTDPHRSAPYPVGVSGIKTLFLFVDYTLGWRLRIRPVISEGGWVIIERGWWDLVVDPKRYRLRRANAVTRLLGRLLPRPDLTVVLEAPQEVLSGRKDELSPEEIKRQALAWREVLPRRTPRHYADATLPPQETAQRILDRLGLERAQKSRGAWMNLPRKGAPRWYLPKVPRAVARKGLSIHQPMSPKALVGWLVARAAVNLGAARLAPNGDPPPRDVTDLVAEHLSPSLHVAVARVYEQARYSCLAMNDAGSAVAFAKIGLGPEGRERLNREADATEKWAALLPAPLAAPALLGREPRLLLFEPVSWRPRLRPWRLPTDVAAAMGRFYAPLGDGPESGPTHGDFTPWNLLRAKEGWLLIDWELATGAGPPFFDPWHYLVQAHALLGRPSAQLLIEGLDGRGWVGEALSAYAGAAGLAGANARSWLIHYLSVSRDNLDLTAPFAAGALKARDALLDRVEDT